jgi:hypothetical protein
MNILKYLNESFKGKDTIHHYNLGGIFYLIGSLYFYMWFMRSENFTFSQTVLYLIFMVIITAILIVLI